MRFAGRMLAEHWIKRDQLENVDRLKAEFFRDPEGGVIADEPELFLPQMQQRHRRASTVLARITRNRRPFSVPVRQGFGCASRLPSWNLTQRSDMRQIAPAVESAA